MPGEQVGSAYAKISLDDSALDSGLNSAKGKFSAALSSMEGKAVGVGKSIGTALAAGTVAAGVAMAGVATVGVKSYMDIESAAADAASKMDLSAIAQKNGTTVGEAFNGIKQHVIEVSRELGQLNTNAFDPTQIATALSGLAAGGFDVASASAENLSSILSLATATNYDLADSSGMAMAAMNTFGMTVDDLGRIADVYTTACGASAVGMGDLNYAMQQAGPVASVANVSFETLTACIEQLSQSNIKGEKAGTALRGSINTLITPSKTLTDNLAAIGLTMKDVDPRTNDFVDILEKMKSQADKSGLGLSAFTKIFGAEGGLIYKMAEGTDGINTFRDGLLNCEGASGNMAKMMLDTLKGSFDAALGTATDLAIGIGQDLAPTIKGLLDWFSSDGAPAIRELYTAFKEGDWGKIGDTIASAVKAGWSKLKDIGSQLFGWLKAVNWGGVGEYIVNGIKAAWNELMSLGGQLLSALMAVDWMSVGTSILDSISSAIDSVIDYAEGIYDYFANIDWGSVWDSLVSAWDSAIESLSNVGETILGYFDSIDWGTVGFKIGQAIRDAIATLADIGQKVWDYLTSADWSGAGSSITEKIKGGLDKLKEFWNEFKTGLSVVDFTTAGKEIGEKITKGLGQITDYAKSIYDKLKKGWDDWIAADGPAKLGASFGHSLIKGVVDLGKWIYDKIADYWKSNGSSIGSNFAALFHSAIDFGKTALKAAYDFVVGFGNTVLKAGKGTIGASILEIIGNAMNDAWSGAGDSLIEAAKEWRKDAESIWEASDFDTTIAATVDWLGGTPLPADGERRSVIYDVTTTGGPNLTPLRGGTGQPVVSYQGGQLSTQLQNGNWMSATNWANQLGASGQTETAAFLAEIKTWKVAGFNLPPSEIEKLTAAFVAGRDKYEADKAAREAPAKEEAAIGIEGAKEEAEIETDAAEDAATTKTTAAKEAAATETTAAKDVTLTFRQQIWKAVDDANTLWRQGGEAIKYGMTEDGRKIAVIGQVAQRQFEGAGGKWVAGTTAASNQFCTAIGMSGHELAVTLGLASGETSRGIIAAAGIFQGVIDGSGQQFKLATGNAVTDLTTKVKNTATDWITKYSIASTNEQTKLITTGAGIRNNLDMGGLSAKNNLVAGGNWIYEKGVAAGNSISNAASTLFSRVSSLISSANNTISNTRTLYFTNSASNPANAATGKTAAQITTGSFSDPWMNAPKGTSPKGFAVGTMATGPQLSLIGEDGPANPEFVIPTKTKRWDLLFAAMRSYGIPGFAEGTSTGTASSDAVDADKMTAYFGIVGLASMSKQVKKIITDLKDFFRISWGIVKAEGSTYWKQINAVLTTEITAIRDNGWQAALDIRNAWIATSAGILDDAKAQWASYWPAIEPSLSSLKDSLISSFEQAGDGAKNAIDSMVMNSESSLQAFGQAWAEIWSQLVTDMDAAQTQISEGVAAIAEMLKSISVNVNISGGGGYGGGGGGGGGGFPGDWDFGGGGDWLAPTGDWSDWGGGNSYNINTNGGGCTIGGGGCTLTAGGCPSYLAAVQSSTGPLATAGLGYTGGSSYSGGGGYADISYALPAIFRAKGALVDKGPELSIIGESGPEMVLPAKLTRMFVSLADMGANAIGGGRQVIEDRTVHEHHHYWDGKRVTDMVMTASMKRLQLRGAVPSR